MLKEFTQYLTSLSFAGNNNPATYIPTEYVPESVCLQSTERYQEHPSRHRVGFDTVRITDFTAYLASESQGAYTAVAISPDADGAQAIVDMGHHDEPKWGAHTAQLRMQRTPEFAAIEDIVGKPLTQTDMAEFLEDYGYCITPVIQRSDAENPEDGTIGQAVQIIRKIEINRKQESSHEDDDYSAKLEGMEAIDMRGRDGKKIVSLKCRLQCYEDTAERVVEVRMSKMLEGNTPRLKLRIVAPDTIRRAIQDEMESRIKGHADLAGVRVLIGHIKHQ